MTKGDQPRIGGKPLLGSRAAVGALAVRTEKLTMEADAVMVSSKICTFETPGSYAIFSTRTFHIYMYVCVSVCVFLFFTPNTFLARDDTVATARDEWIAIPVTSVDSS